MRCRAAFLGLAVASASTAASLVACPARADAPSDLSASSGPLAPVRAAPEPLPAPPPLLPAPLPDRAAPEPNIEAALLAGAATGLIPLTLGGVLASSGRTYGEKNAGLFIAGAGFTLAPLVSHGVIHEWKRGLLFSALPAATEAAMIGMLEAREDAVFAGTTLSRTTYALLLSFDIFGSAIGLVDVMMAGDRRKGRGFLFLPTISHNQLGFTFGGPL